MLNVKYFYIEQFYIERLHDSVKKSMRLQEKCKEFYRSTVERRKESGRCTSLRI